MKNYPPPKPVPSAHTSDKGKGKGKRSQPLHLHEDTPTGTLPTSSDNTENPPTTQTHSPPTPPTPGFNIHIPFYQNREPMNGDTQPNPQPILEPITDSPLSELSSLSILDPKTKNTKENPQTLVIRDSDLPSPAQDSAPFQPTPNISAETSPMALFPATTPQPPTDRNQTKHNIISPIILPFPSFHKHNTPFIC